MGPGLALNNGHIRPNCSLCEHSEQLLWPRARRISCGSPGPCYGVNCAQPGLEVPAVRMVHFRGKMNSDIQMDTFLDAVLSCPNLVEVMVSRLPRAQLWWDRLNWRPLMLGRLSDKGTSAGSWSVPAYPFREVRLGQRPGRSRDFLFWPWSPADWPNLPPDDLTYGRIW